MDCQIQGLSIHAEQRGSAEPAIVFLHYWGGTSRTWRKVVADLEGQFMTVVYEDGSSERPREPDETAPAFAMIRCCVGAITPYTMECARFIALGHSSSMRIGENFASMPIPHAQELLMSKTEYEVFEALNPFFEVVQKGLSGLVDGEHYFDTIAEDAFFEFRYHFPGWPLTIRGRADLMARFAGYGNTIKLRSGDALVVHRSQDNRVVILEYEVHGTIISSGALYDNRLISVVTIKNRKIVHWRDYMDSLAAWTVLNSTV